MFEGTWGDETTDRTRSLRRNRELPNVVSVSSMRIGILSILLTTAYPKWCLANGKHSANNC